jgi:hypothetical protein
VAARQTKNRRGCRRFLGLRAFVFVYAFASPAAERCEKKNQKNVKDGARIGATLPPAHGPCQERRMH